jgi:hypothetical protein
LKHIRLATPEEIETFKERADLTPTCSVFALDTASGTDFAVVRHCYEVDPYITEKPDARRKALFIFALESGMKMLNIDRYYFNIKPQDETFINVAQHWGAQQVSEEPELRFVKTL